jgi:hypothetical protein
MAQGEESNIAKIVRVFVDQLQGVEDAVLDVKFLQQIDYAIGAQLDGLGELVGEPRLGRSDADYKPAIYFRMFLNAGRGEPELLIAAIRTFTLSNHIEYAEMHPAKVLLSFDGTLLHSDLQVQMQRLCPAGVDLDLIQIDAEEPFVFTDDGVTLPDTEGKGFSEDDYLEGGQPVGGKLGELLT